MAATFEAFMFSCEADSLVRLVYMQLSDFRDIFLCELKVVRLSLSVIMTLGLSVFLSSSWSVNSSFACLCF